MNENVDKDMLWLRLLEKYLPNECNLKRIKADSFIFYRKHDNAQLDLVISVHVDNVFMAENLGRF